MGPHVSKLRFCAERALEVQHMSNSHSRIVMPWSETNADGEGGVHEGALLALFDTTGAMAAWADAGPGPYKASTPSIQAQILAPPSRQDLVAYGKCVQRDGDLFWCDVEVAGESGEQPGALVARGTVIYRIVT
jgi:acyl-coenzyme A thioesterase PaaI-like protein